MPDQAHQALFARADKRPSDTPERTAGLSFSQGCARRNVVLAYQPEGESPVYFYSVGGNANPSERSGSILMFTEVIDGVSYRRFLTDKQFVHFRTVAGNERARSRVPSEASVLRYMNSFKGKAALIWSEKSE
jgi:hypothetical protein